jgi:UPF0755 protein
VSERDDWLVDSEGNLSPPRSDRSSDTDEFGRTDPAALERERRRREREARRRGRTDGHGDTGEQPRPTPPQPPSEPAEPRAETGRAAAASLRERFRRGKRRQQRAAPQRTIWRRRIIGIAAAIAAVLVVWFLVALFQPFAGDGGGEGRVAVNIPQGASAAQVADILAEQGVVDNATFFEWRLRLSGKEDEIIPGALAMASGMSYSAAIDRLTGTSSEQGTLVIPEGYSREQIGPLLADSGVEGDYLAASKSFKGFHPTEYGAEGDPPSLEGFLFPATYEVKPGESADDLVGEQLEAFRSNLKQVDLSYAKKKGNLTPYDVLIIASMIDREVVVPKERPQVAAVIWNRLSRGEPLAIDATTRYEHNEWVKPITQAQLDKDTPYNTRLNVGLPPTPIGNPGLDAIKAAAHPADVGYLFYVVKPDTCPPSHTFTKSYDEFLKLSEQYNQARAEAGNESPTC